MTYGKKLKSATLSQIIYLLDAHVEEDGEEGAVDDFYVKRMWHHEIESKEEL